MYIKKIEPPDPGCHEVFAAMDDMGRRLGRATVTARMNEQQMPDRPFEVTIAVSGQNEARPQLVAAATVSAMVLVRAQQPPVPSRVLTRCGPRNGVLLQLLQSIGYKNDDELTRFSRSDLQGGSTAHPPQGTLLIRDALDDEAEKRFFLQRLERLHGVDDAEAWLSERRKRPGFQRFLLAGGEGLAGELVCWAEEGPSGLHGVIGLVYTVPDWRKRGVAGCLMEAARVHFAGARLNDVTADVRKRNTAAVRLLYSAGYRPAQTLALMPGINL